MHLRANAPVARAEKDEKWFLVMEDLFRAIREAMNKWKCYNLICAGDIVHKWNSPPELINHAIENMPEMYSIPGQHDLPLHSHAEIKKSAYWTLHKADRLIHVDEPILIEGDPSFAIHPFPWGKKITPPAKIGWKSTIHLAVVHAYIWSTKETAYNGAAEEQNIKKYGPLLSQYDAAVFGDNHNGFLGRYGKTYILNNGCLIQQKTDEANNEPSYGVLHADGSISRHPLKVAKAEWEEELVTAIKNEPNKDVEGFIQLLSDSADTSLNFADVLRQYMNQMKVSKQVRSIVLRALEG